MIQSPLLTDMSGYVAGRWVQAHDGSVIPVMNPATGEHLADVPDMGSQETTEAIQAAEEALKRIPSIDQRRTWLKALGDAMLAQKEELARIVTLEQGKPLAEGIGGVEYAAGFYHFFADQLDHLKDQSLPGPVRGCHWQVSYRPAGVVGLIWPWNYPHATLAKKLAGALAAGCTIVAKPSELTPLSAIAMMKLVDGIGLDPGRLNIVIGQPEPIGQVLCTHPAVRLISFTGSTEVGHKLAAAVAPHTKRLALELGGNTPFIVFDDADLNAAVDGLVTNKFRAGGQTCVCTNRLYVHRQVKDAFLDLLVPRVKAIKVGNGLDPATNIGPLINRDGFDKVTRHVQDALAKGATRLVGDDPQRPEHDWGAFYPPTILTDICSDMVLCQEETFGPVIAVTTFDDTNQVIDAANSTDYGLAAYLYTADVDKAQSIIAQLRFGHIGLNTGTGPSPHAPFGGMKQSGYGREGGVEGLLEFCEIQAIAQG